MRGLEKLEQHLNMQGHQGLAALSHAAKAASSGAVRMLLQYGADRYIADQDGKTALMHAYDLHPSQRKEVIKEFGIMTEELPARVHPVIEAAAAKHARAHIRGP